MSYKIRKKLWDQFYNAVLIDILIDGKIKSPTLKKSFNHIQGVSLYICLIEDLKVLFNTAELNYLFHYFTTVIEESCSKEESEKFINRVLTSV